MMWTMMAAAAACVVASEPPRPACNPNLRPPVHDLGHDMSEVRAPARGGGELFAIMIDGGPNTPAVLLLPGSGPTDHDGNSAAGVSGGIYLQLAHALYEKGVSTIRADKRGIGLSKVDGDPNAVTIDDYVADTLPWRSMFQARGHRCTWLAGHSEGGLIALAAAAQKPDDLCGVILIAAPGRRMDTILKSQLKSKLPPAMWTPTEAALDRLARGEKVDLATVPAPLHNLFAPQVQGFLIDMMRYDPAALAAKIKLPVLIVQGEEDLQVSVEDAKALKSAQPDAALVLLDGTNHVLKSVPKGDAAANAASYGNAQMPIDARVANAIANFIRLKR